MVCQIHRRDRAEKQKDVAEEATKIIVGLIQEVEKAKATEESAKKSSVEAHKAAKESKKVVMTWEKAYKELEARVDLTKANAKFAEDCLAKEQASLKTKLDDGKDALVDTAMFRFWTYNPNIDLSFLENEVEATVVR